MLLGRKLISPADNRKYTIDYNDWLDSVETLSSVTFAVATGPAAVTLVAIATDGKSVTFHVSGASLSFTPFNITVVAVTTLTQTKNDHIEMDVVAA